MPRGTRPPASRAGSIQPSNRPARVSVAHAGQATGQPSESKQVARVKPKQGKLADRWAIDKQKFLTAFDEQSWKSEKFLRPLLEALDNGHGWDDIVRVVGRAATARRGGNSHLKLWTPRDINKGLLELDSATVDPIEISSDVSEDLDSDEDVNTQNDGNEPDRDSDGGKDHDERAGCGAEPTNGDSQPSQRRDIRDLHMNGKAEQSKEIDSTDKNKPSPNPFRVGGQKPETPSNIGEDHQELTKDTMPPMYPLPALLTSRDVGTSMEDNPWSPTSPHDLVRQPRQETSERAATCNSLALHTARSTYPAGLSPPCSQQSTRLPQAPQIPRSLANHLFSPHQILLSSTVSAASPQFRLSTPESTLPEAQSGPSQTLKHGMLEDSTDIPQRSKRPRGSSPGSLFAPLLKTPFRRQLRIQQQEQTEAWSVPQPEPPRQPASADVHDTTDQDFVVLIPYGDSRSWSQKQVNNAIGSLQVTRQALEQARTLVSRLQAKEAELEATVRPCTSRLELLTTKAVDARASYSEDPELLEALYPPLQILVQKQIAKLEKVKASHETAAEDLRNATTSFDSARLANDTAKAHLQDLYEYSITVFERMGKAVSSMESLL